MTPEGDAGEARVRGSSAPPRALLAGIAVFTVLAAALTTGLIAQQRRAALAFWEERLAWRADDSRLAVEEWLSERLADARVLASYPSVVGALDHHHGAHEGHENHLVEVLTRFNDNERQVATLVLDAGGRVVAAAGDRVALEPGSAAAPAERVALIGPEERLRLIVQVPVPNPHSAGERLGSVVLVIDPNQALWPKLRRESDPTRSEETVVAIEERDGAVVIVPLPRGAEATPIRLTDAPPDLAGRVALAGEPRVGRFADYRGRRVIAATQPIRGSGWALVRKIDESEALADFRAAAWRLALIGGLVSLAFAGTLIELWRRQRLRAVEAELERERRARRERRRYEERVDHLLGVIAAARRVSHMLGRETDRQRLLQQTCDLLAQARAYRLAWIGEAVEEGHRIIPRAASGLGVDYLDAVTITWDDSPTGRGPSGEALRLRTTTVLRDIAADQRFDPWREAALARGFASSAAVPILHQDRVYGVLSVYGGTRDVFDAEEVALLEELADDVGHALHGLELRAENERVTASLRESEARYRELNAVLEKRVGERTAELERINQELTSFNYSVSHDLRAPLRHMSSFAEVLLEGDTDSPEQRRHYLEQIVSGSTRMGELIDALLLLSRAGQAALQRRPVDLAALARTTFEDLRPPDREVEFRVGELPTVSGDPVLLRQVLDNLLSNALKFTRPRQVAQIELGFERDRATPAFFVRDNGVGYDPRYAGRLFEVFQRLHPQGEFEGTGIGLSLVRRIIRRHGGTVWAEGAVDAGCTVYFTLPDPSAADAPTP